MCAPPLLQTSDESPLVSEVKKHWSLLLLGTNCSLISLTFWLLLLSGFTPFHSSICLLSPCFQLKKMSLHSLFLLVLLFTTFTTFYLALFLPANSLTAQQEFFRKAKPRSHLRALQHSATDHRNLNSWALDLVQFTEKRWQCLNMSEFLFNYAGSLYPSD